MILSRTILSIPLLTTLTSAITLTCDHLRVDGIKWDLSNLTGPHSVWMIDKDSPPAEYNVTWTVDICKKLVRDDNISKADQCPDGTQVCGIRRSYNPIDDPNKEKIEVENVIPVAGNYHTTDGKGLDPLLTRLKSENADTEGIQIEMGGGTYAKRSQKAIIRLICDKTKTGNEGSDNATSTAKLLEGGNATASNGSLIYQSYGPEGDFDILRLNWTTMYACEDALSQGEETTGGGGWGFFTWLILILFLGIAAYLIFGSWLNYNRYGARGWDLLPHGDTIRDVPYLFKDWIKRVIDTVSGSGRRGGYSAV